MSSHNLLEMLSPLHSARRGGARGCGGPAGRGGEVPRAGGVNALRAPTRARDATQPGESWAASLRSFLAARRRRVFALSRPAEGRRRGEEEASWIWVSAARLVCSGLPQGLARELAPRGHNPAGAPSVIQKDWLLTEALS